MKIIDEFGLCLFVRTFRAYDDNIGMLHHAWQHRLDDQRLAGLCIRVILSDGAARGVNARGRRDVMTRRLPRLPRPGRRNVKGLAYERAELHDAQRALQRVALRYKGGGAARGGGGMSDVHRTVTLSAPSSSFHVRHRKPLHSPRTPGKHHSSGTAGREGPPASHCTVLTHIHTRGASHVTQTDALGATVPRRSTAPCGTPRPAAPRTPLPC